MFISCLDKRKNFYLLKKKCMDCILFIFQKIFLKENCSFVGKMMIEISKEICTAYFLKRNKCIFSTY